MRIANVPFLLSLMMNWRVIHSYSLPTWRSSLLVGGSFCSRQNASNPPSLSLLRPLARNRSQTSCFLSATTQSKENNSNEQTQPIDASFWSARQDCWRPDVRDVEKISWGMPASKKGKRTGSRGVPHRLNEEERRAFDQARRQGFLQVTGSSWRSQRRDAPLLNSYRSLMDARGRPMIVLHKLSPNSSGGVDHEDMLVVDLSPLRLPKDFELVEQGLKERVLAELDIEYNPLELDEEDIEETDELANLDSNAEEDGEDWGTRPIYQLSPFSVSWKVSRQQGKQLGKFLGSLFDNVEEKATKKSQKPKGVKPGKGRRHGGYGIG